MRRRLGSTRGALSDLRRSPRGRGGRDVLQAVIGDGAKKRVYRGLDTRLGREVAIAILRAPDAGAASLAALREEARDLKVDGKVVSTRSRSSSSSTKSSTSEAPDSRDVEDGMRRASPEEDRGAESGQGARVPRRSPAGRVQRSAGSSRACSGVHGLPSRPTRAAPADRLGCPAPRRRASTSTSPRPFRTPAGR